MGVSCYCVMRWQQLLLCTAQSDDRDQPACRRRCEQSQMQYSAIGRGWMVIGRGWSEGRAHLRLAGEHWSLATRLVSLLSVSLQQALSRSTGASTRLTLFPLAAEKAGPAWLIPRRAYHTRLINRPPIDVHQTADTSYLPSSTSHQHCYTAFKGLFAKHHRHRHTRALTSGASAGGKQSKAWAAAIPSLASVESGWALVLDGWAGRADKRHGLTHHHPPSEQTCLHHHPPPLLRHRHEPLHHRRRIANFSSPSPYSTTATRASGFASARRRLLQAPRQAARTPGTPPLCTQTSRYSTHKALSPSDPGTRPDPSRKEVLLRVFLQTSDSISGGVESHCAG